MEIFYLYAYDAALREDDIEDDDDYSPCVYKDPSGASSEPDAASSSGYDNDRTYPRTSPRSQPKGVADHRIAAAAVAAS